MFYFIMLGDDLFDGYLKFIQLTHSTSLTFIPPTQPPIHLACLLKYKMLLTIDMFRLNIKIRISESEAHYYKTSSMVSNLRNPLFISVLYTSIFLFLLSTLPFPQVLFEQT